MSGHPVVAGRSEPQSSFASRHLARLLARATPPAAACAATARSTPASAPCSTGDDSEPRDEALAVLEDTIATTRDLDDQLVLGPALVLHGSHAGEADEEEEGRRILAKLGVDPSLHLTPPR